MSVEASLRSAKQHLQSGRPLEAEAIFRQVLAVEPRNADALQFLGVIAHQTGRTDIAVPLIRQAIAQLPTSADAYLNLANALRDSGQMEEAIGAYRRALELDPDLAGAHNNLGNVLRNRGQLDEAITAFRRVVTLRPEVPEVHYNLGNALQDRGEMDGAIAAYRNALQLRPDYAEAFCNLGSALQEKGVLDESIAAFRQAIACTPDLAIAHRHLGSALRVTGQIDAAVSSYRTVLRLQPDDPDAYANLGAALRQQGRHEEAVAAFRTALGLRPDSADYRYVLASLQEGVPATRAPPGFVRELFDSYAGRFDEHLVGTLSYQVPELLLDAVLKAAPGRTFDVLDLGCGTGLCGVQFRAVAHRLVGVDLSPKMIRRASQRGIYDQLLTEDVVAMLTGETASFDLILGGDVFIYLGDLDDVFAAAKRTLRGSGLLAFSIERHEGQGFALTPTARFVHSLAYVRDLSKTHGFMEVSAQEIIVRKDFLKDVAGWVVVLQYPANPARSVS